MNRMKETLDKHVLNEQKMLNRIQQDVQHRKILEARRRRLWIASSAAVFVLLAVSLIGLQILTPITANPSETTTSLIDATTQRESEIVYAMVSVDINPSFEIYTNKGGHVVQFKVKNKDAESVGTDDLLGVPVEEAVVGLIKRASAAGFIKNHDSTDDYVIVSTVVLDEEDQDANKNQDSLGYKIQQAVEAADLETTTKVAVIKATLQEKFAADGKDIPLGLSIINNMVPGNNKTLSVSEFVKERNNLRKLEKRAMILEAKADRKAAQESRQAANGSEADDTDDTDD